MSYTALYRKYRPQTFDDVVGQQHIVTTLNNALDQNKLAHAYLFSGPSGNGKTSIAKLFAKAINCENPNSLICDTCENCESTRLGIHPDVVEIDAASNNGVDEIRSLIEKVKYAPLNGKYKVYIIDEVHMLSLGAFNALLKTLEEPPSHVVFILATTEPHKVIPTIISRCQRYDFTKVQKQDLTFNIERILNKENINYEIEAIDLISELADGGVRESLSILEQTIAYAIDNIKLNDVRQIYGIVTKEEKIALLMNIFSKNIQETLNTLNTITDQGNNLERLSVDIIKILKEATIYAYSKSQDLLEVCNENEVKDILNYVSARQLLQMIDILMEISSLKKNISDLHAYLELGFIKMINIVETNEKQSAKKVESNNTINTLSNKDSIKPDHKSLVNNHTVNKPAVKETVVEKTIDEVVNITKKPIDLKEEANKPINNENVIEVKKELIVEEKVVNKDIEKPVAIDEESLLSLLAFANKEKRIQMDAKWSNINSFMSDINFAKYAHKLKFARLLAVGDNYALVCVENQIVADDINSQDNQEGITHFINEKLLERLKVIAISEQKSGKLIAEFRNRAASNTLPSKVDIEVPELKRSSKKESIEEKAISLFGEDNYIMED